MTLATIAALVVAVAPITALRPAPASAASAFIDLSGPVGSGAFGRVTVLANGNVVVVDQFFDLPGTQNVGAVRLYDGTTRTLISTITGSTANDLVGAFGVAALPSGNFLVFSPFWRNGSAANAGAVTFGSGTSGVSGTVSAANSLVGTHANDKIGLYGVTVLTNGNYVVRNQDWDNGIITNAGAVTWGDGVTGTTGEVSVTNSLVGGGFSDLIGFAGVTALTNGNYVVDSTRWDNGSANDAGAVTWGNGTTGTTGVVSATNSLVGTQTFDIVGGWSVTALTNGNYVVASPFWANGSDANAGAVTWADGTTGITGVVSAANSLIGVHANDRIGNQGVTALTNGNYVATSSFWTNGSEPAAGAVTWADGTTGITGEVTASNSLVGTLISDFVGYEGVIALTNGNYVVASPLWSSTNVGAVTWGNGATGTFGAVSAGNSLVGVKSNDRIGGDIDDSIVGITALTNGNYVVTSPLWDDSNSDVGAVTLGNGATGTTGQVTTANSLVGSTTGDEVGLAGVTALTNGNFVVRSPLWDGSALNTGAVTWGSGTSGVIGAVSASNSLVGSTSSDQVGLAAVVTLTNGNYVVPVPTWNQPAAGPVDVGAVTWGSGTAGVSGAISASNSLVGTTAGDQVGSRVTALSNGGYLVTSASWDNDATPDSGAVTWGNGIAGTVGSLPTSATVLGLAASGGINLDPEFDPVHGAVVVGRQDEQLVTWMVLVPTAPSGVVAVPGEANAAVSWGAPASAGVSSITGYTVTAAPGGASCATNGALSCTVPGLTNGVTYTFTVRAANAAGPGPASAPSAAVVPQVVLPTSFANSAKLLSGKSLGVGQFLLSKDARTLFGLRTDGNLILVVNGALVFQSATAGQGVTGASMNKSGALQLLGTGGAVVWTSNTTKKGASLEVRDGRVVVKSGSKILWSQGPGITALKAKGSNTLGSGGSLPSGSFLRSKNNRCGAALIGGDIVVWSAGGRVSWRSNTSGSGGVSLKLQTTGNLQLLTKAKAVVWATNTAGKSAKLVLDNSCRLVLSTKTATLWQSN